MKKVIFTFVMTMLLMASSFAQDAKALENNTNIIKTNFPKIYGVIKNEAKARYFNDYSLQKDEINIQCYAFSLFTVLVFTDPPSIPRNVLSDIQIQAIKKSCKNFTMDTSCEQVTDQFKKLDCNLSYMIIDWINVISEMDKQIKAYNDLNKPI